MKRILLLSLFLFACFFAKSQTLYFENFNSVADGATSGTSATVTGSAAAAQRTWSVTTAPSGGTFSKQTYGGLERFTINQTGTNEGVWSTGVVSIPAGRQIAVNISLITYNAGPADYVRAYYKLNGGAEVLFGSAIGGNYIISEGASVVLSGTTVQIVVRGKENTAGDDGGGNPNMMRFDDIEITEIRNLYSRTDAAWNVGTTWSLSDAVGATGGASCGCTPLDTDNVIIRAEDAVTLPAITAGGGNGTDGTTVSGNAEVVNVTVRSGGSISFTANEVLSIMRGGSINVASGAAISSGANTGAQIVIRAAAPASVVVDGALTIGDFSVNAAATLTFSGIGAFTTQDDFLITAAATIVNNLTSFTVQDDFNFNTDNATVTNNGTLTVSSDIQANDTDDDGNQIINSSGGTLAFVNMDALATGTGAGGFLSISNSGTINQTGTFQDIESSTNASNDINNLTGGTWNYSGTGHDTDLRLYANNGTNLFHYNLNGNQQIITPVTGNAYSNLTLSTGGTKTSLGHLDINGNLIVQTNGVIFNCNNFNTIIAGNWTFSNTASFSSGVGILTFDGTTANQTISVASGAQTYNSLVINNTFGNVILSSTAISASTLTLTNGGLQLNGNSLAILTTPTTAINRTNGFIISETTGTPYAPVVWTMGTATGTYVFPFATASGAANYIPFTFTITGAGTGGAGKISVATYPTVSANTPYPSGVTHVKNASGANNSTNTVDRFWIITPTSYTTNPTASLTFTARTAEIGTITTLRPQRWNGTNWDLPLATASGTATTGSVTGVTTFSPWAMSGNNSPLPVELKYFKAAIDGDAVKLDWETAQELNNDFFTVEKTADLESFEEIVKREGQGTTTELHHYSEVDSNPYFGRSYYRLKQTDFDGKFTYSNVQVIDYSGPQFAFLRAYPSPSKDRKITIEIKGLKETKSIPVQIVNAQGQKVMEKTLEVKTPGSVKEEMAFDSSLPAGLYIIKAGNTLQLTQKIVVE